MKQIIRPLKGTRDFYPEEMFIHLWLEKTLRSVSQSYGYEAWEGPYLEKIDLYAAKSGEELVKEQAFCFADRGGDFITLRPELTPTLARMVAEKQAQLVLPLRWYSFGPFWRYERPQRGRTREFFQWNIDMIGVNSPEADAELIAVSAAFFDRVGLGSDVVKIKVNDRQLVDKKLAELGLAHEQHHLVFKMIDRKPKLPEAAWEQFVLDSGFSADQLAGIKAIIHNSDLWKESPTLCRILELLEAMGWGNYVEYDPSVIRGLDYYTGIVFEAVEVTGGRAILGGGHYDNLVSDVGGASMPGIGFAMGDVMIKIVLGDHGLLPQAEPQKDAVLVTVFDEQSSLATQAFAAKLRKAGIKSVVYPESVKLIKQFRFADRKGIRYVVVLGPDELRNGMMTLKNLESSEQETLSQEKGIAKLKQLLA